MQPREPRNPLYLLLLVIGLLFVLTALAYAVVPVLEQKATEAGNPPPPSPWRDSLRSDGWKWLLAEVAVLIVIGIASMVWDRLRSLQNAEADPTIPMNARLSTSQPGPGVPHEQGQDQPDRQRGGP